MVEKRCEFVEDCSTLKTLDKINPFAPIVISFMINYCHKSEENCSAEDEKKKIGYENCPAYKRLITI